MDALKNTAAENSNELDMAKKTIEAAEERYKELEQAADRNAQELALGKTKLQKANDRILELEPGKEEAEAELRELKQGKGVMGNDENELTEQWKEMKAAEVEQQNLERERNAKDGAKKLEESKRIWEKAITAIQTSTITGDNISLLLLEPVLPLASSRIHIFQPSDLSSHRFSESYLGLDTTQLNQQDITIADLFRWTKDATTPVDPTENDLQQIIWLETHVLEHIRKCDKKRSWMLVALHLVTRKTQSKDWLTHCIAYVSLAVLSKQYIMYYGENWWQLVSEIVTQHPQLDVDPLSQACLAYLAMTTKNPFLYMKHPLAQVFEDGRCTRLSQIPDIMAQLRDDRTVSATVGGIEIVLVRCEDREVVFSRKHPSRSAWIYSLQPVKIVYLQNRCLELTWGPHPDQSIRYSNEHGALYEYLFRYHGRTAVAAAANTLLAKTKQDIAEFVAIPVPIRTSTPTDRPELAALRRDMAW